MSSESARVESIDALKHFRIALFKFIDAANASLSNAESEIRQMANWLENEQYTHWQAQIRKRATMVERCKDAVRAKKLFKDSTGRTPSAVDEEKALRAAVMELEEAETKYANTKKYLRVLQKEFEVYRGGAQRFATTVQVDLPQAAAMLDQMVMALEAYVSLNTADTGPGAPPGIESGPMDVIHEPPKDGT